MNLYHLLASCHPPQGFYLFSSRLVLFDQEELCIHPIRMLPIRRFLGSDLIRRGNSAAPHTGFGQFSFCSHLHGLQVCDDPDLAGLFNFGVGGLVSDPDGPADVVSSSVDITVFQLDRHRLVLRVTLEHEAICPANLPGSA